ncbi:hypothetical protein CEUSTIGMA_g7358.t1 [Chlamydomonas eustigma]|uniref:RWP-RK domain-containing protein n=1 Tax=Chlamydomonas eustigma TaxID=1157962 RepID=A0A250XA08_9CHLO|nr:hypothetical protein CEUSTIGMA_g7358.t1 [Chlamydomonas eustigma]|eukprot:GAX79918.1 hypothetical protein CEUSTIGMA_g7358.t1 [Chlamydomonas eustigma]
MAQNVRDLIFPEAEMQEAYKNIEPAQPSNNAALEQRFMRLLPDLPKEDEELLNEHLSHASAANDEYPWMSSSCTDWINEAVNEIEKGPISRMLDLSAASRSPTTKSTDHRISEQQARPSSHEQDARRVPFVLRLDASASEHNRAINSLGASQNTYLPKAKVLDLTLSGSATFINAYSTESGERFSGQNPGDPSSTSDQSLKAATQVEAIDINLSPLKRGTKEYSLDQLKKAFHLPGKAAAAALGLSNNGLKRLCRGQGISRWPFRKVQGLANLRRAVEQDPNINQEARQALVQQIEADLEAVMENPNLAISRGIYDLCQVNYKQSYSGRLNQSCDSPAANDPLSPGEDRRAGSAIWDIGAELQAGVDSRSGGMLSDSGGSGLIQGIEGGGEVAATRRGIEAEGPSYQLVGVVEADVTVAPGSSRGTLVEEGSKRLPVRRRKRDQSILSIAVNKNLAAILGGAGFGARRSGKATGRGQQMSRRVSASSSGLSNAPLSLTERTTNTSLTDVPQLSLALCASNQYSRPPTVDITVTLQNPVPSLEGQLTAPVSNNLQPAHPFAANPLGTTASGRRRQPSYIGLLKEGSLFSEADGVWHGVTERSSSSRGLLEGGDIAVEPGGSGMGVVGTFHRHPQDNDQGPAPGPRDPWQDVGDGPDNGGMVFLDALMECWSDDVDFMNLSGNGVDFSAPE